MTSPNFNQCISNLPPLTLQSNSLLSRRLHTINGVSTAYTYSLRDVFGSSGHLSVVGSPYYQEEFYLPRFNEINASLLHRLSILTIMEFLDAFLQFLICLSIKNLMLNTALLKNITSVNLSPASDREPRITLELNI